MIFLHIESPKGTYLLCLWMASQFGCKLRPACRINPQASLPPKAAPIVPQRPPPHSCPPSTSEARLLACFCHCNEAKPRPEVSAVRFPKTLTECWSLKSQYPPSYLQSHSIFLLKLSSLFKWAEALHLAFHPSFLLPLQLFLFIFFVHKETLPHLDCLYAVVKS